jgi:FUN14 domain-containing protein 1
MATVYKTDAKIIVDEAVAAASSLGYPTAPSNAKKGGAPSTAVSSFSPNRLAGKFGIGTVFGICAGAALKRFTKDAAVVAGTGLISLQILQHYGYITIQWKKVQSDIVHAVDQDGDGEFTYKDVGMLLKRFILFVGHGIPNAAGFSTGVYTGLKYF